MLCDDSLVYSPLMWTISPFLPHFMKFLFKFLFPSSLKSELLQVFLFTLKCIQKNWFLQFAHFYCHFYSNKTKTRWLRQCRVVSYNQSKNHSDHSLQLFFFNLFIYSELFCFKHISFILLSEIAPSSHIPRKEAASELSDF